jgi:large subunit ribosomal protein L6
MSRIGLSTIKIPDGVTVTQDADKILAKGKIGELSVKMHESINIKIDNNIIVFSTNKKSKQARALWGTTRANVANIIKGVSEGFEKNLELSGVGYRAQVQGSKIILNLGYSHPVEMLIPPGIKVTSEKPTELKLFGANRQLLGQFAANVRSKRPPEPFKGKGVKYVNEFIFRKEGKKK